jgi:hypothetical protein
MTRLHRMVTVALAAGVLTLPADTIQLRDGRRVEGTYLGGDTRQVKLLDADGKLQSFDIGDVDTIRFKSSAVTASTEAPAPSLARPPAARAAAPRVAAASRATVPAGTVLTVRMIDSIDSDVNRTGERFRASLDQPLQVGDETIAERGADATVQLVRVEQSGKLTGRDELAMDLYDITIEGRKYQVATSYAEVESKSRTASTAKVVGGTAALGAIIGAIAGGGKGAAIGAASGAGVGAGVQILTKGAKVKIPSESRLEFTLKQPLAVQ